METSCSPTPSSVEPTSPPDWPTHSPRRLDDALQLVDGEDSKDFLVAKRKPSGACADCKSVKVRCEPVPGQRKCKRCQLKNLPCQARERKRRKAAETHEELQEKARQQDFQIQELLRQYDSQRAADKITHWMTKSNPFNSRGFPANSKSAAIRHRWMQRGLSVEQASLSYFRNAGRLDTANLPAIVNHCDLYPEEIEDLFAIFFNQINPYFSILDEGYHKPATLIWTAPFLFTVVCAISSRHYASRPELYPLAMDFARDMAGKALVEGKRSIDMCQAYLLMAVYPVPKKKWVEDRSWLLMGVAIRMAMELGLNQPAPGDCSEMERLNRVRTWLTCYCVDGSHAIQFGKMPMLPLDDYLARTLSNTWYMSSNLNNPFDVHLCGYVQVLSIMAEWRTANAAQLQDPNLNDSSIIELALETRGKLQKEIGRWREAYARELQLFPLPICRYRAFTTPMITAYLELVVLSSGFQAEFRSGSFESSVVLPLALGSAHEVIRSVIEDLAPTGYLRYAMDSNFLYVSFAASFLINLLRPKFKRMLDECQRQRIIDAVTNLTEVLTSAKVALDARHTPVLYARFLLSLLNKYHYRAQSITPSMSSHVKASPTPPSDMYFWPEVCNSSASVGSPSALGANFEDGLIYSRFGEALGLQPSHLIRQEPGYYGAHQGVSYSGDVSSFLTRNESFDLRNSAPGGRSFGPLS
ncbi:priB protein [Coprinopsis cinerea AmutBmut pab1-1]|nr:priB protein [Coprinopsis cinerea AmutBmut pab1-1]